MKKIIIILIAILVSACSNYKVYSVRDNPTLPVRGGVLYALPRTQLRVAVTVERRDLSSAPYAGFAADMLGATDADIDTSFRIVDIDVTPNNIADPDYYYFVKVRRGSVSVDDRHLLMAIGERNVNQNGYCKSPSTENKNENENENENENQNQNSKLKTQNIKQNQLAYNLYDRADTFYTRYDSPDHPSLVTTKKDVRTPRQRAEEVAIRIDELQVRQRELLTGDAEGIHDAETMRFLIDELRRQENGLKSLFLGETRCETVVFYVDPALRKGEDFVDTVAWFSPREGFVWNERYSDAESTGLHEAFPIVCSVRPESSLKGVNRFVRYHTAGSAPSSSANRSGKAASKTRARKTFRYRIPEQATVSILTPLFSFSRQMPVSQFGPTVELPHRRIKAHFDPQTLDLRELIIEN